MTEKDLAELQNIPLDERIKRIEKMLEGKESPRAFELGMLLALKMAQEIREKKPLGSESGEVVISWNGKVSESTIEEAIATAKEFLIHPASIAEKIKAELTRPAEKADNAGDENSEKSGDGNIDEK